MFEEDLVRVFVDVIEWLVVVVIKMLDCQKFLIQMVKIVDGLRFKCQLVMFFNIVIIFLTDFKDKIYWCGKQLYFLYQFYFEGQLRLDWEEIVVMVIEICQSFVFYQIQGNVISLNLLVDLINLILDYFKDKIGKYFWFLYIRL